MSRKLRTLIPNMDKPLKKRIIDNAVKQRYDQVAHDLKKLNNLHKLLSIEHWSYNEGQGPEEDTESLITNHLEKW